MMGFEAEDFVAIGDSANDAEMFEAAGFEVAVANGDERVKRGCQLRNRGIFWGRAVEAIEFP